VDWVAMLLLWRRGIIGATCIVAGRRRRCCGEDSLWIAVVGEGGDGEVRAG
jgi:hypothetical protein